MESTAFQAQWRHLAATWGLHIEAPHAVEVARRQIQVPVLLRDFGAPLGMLLVTDFDTVSAVTDELVGLGYGFSCLSEPNDADDPGEERAIFEMLVDWGWSGSGPPPAWYRGSID